MYKNLHSKKVIERIDSINEDEEEHQEINKETKNAFKNAKKTGTISMPTIKKQTKIFIV